jgi:hypothetical protein
LHAFELLASSNVCTPHATQLVPPAAPWYLPLPQKEQPAVPVAALNCPGAQFWQVPALAPPQPEWNEPAAQV